MPRIVVLPRPLPGARVPLRETLPFTEPLPFSRPLTLTLPLIRPLFTNDAPPATDNVLADVLPESWLEPLEMVTLPIVLTPLSVLAAVKVAVPLMIKFEPLIVPPVELTLPPTVPDPPRVAPEATFTVLEPDSDPFTSSSPAETVVVPVYVFEPESPHVPEPFLTNVKALVPLLAMTPAKVFAALLKPVKVKVLATLAVA